MSYINDALRKAQAENQPDSARFGSLMAPGTTEAAKPRRLLWAAGFAAVFVSVAVVVYLVYWTGEEQPAAPVSEVKTNVAAIAPSVPSPAAQNNRVTPATPVAAPVSAPEPQKNVATVEPPATAEIKTAEPRMMQSVATAAALPGPAKEQRWGREKTGQAPGVAADEAPVLEKKPGNPKLLYAKALKMQNEGRTDQAEALYEQVLQGDPRHLASINNLGVICMQKKKYKRAIAYFHNAIAIKHDYIDGHYNLACLYAKKNDTKQSLFYLKNAIDFNPEARRWAEKDNDLQTLSSVPEFQKLMRKQDN